MDEFDAGVKEYTETIIKDETEFWVTYAGTLGKSYDISTLIYASSEILKRGYKNIKIKNSWEWADTGRVKENNRFTLL